MENIIIDREDLPLVVCELLSPRIRDGIIAFLSSFGIKGEAVEEIRIKRGGGIWISASCENYFVGIYPTGAEFDEILVRACDGSLYAYASTIKNGYIPVGNGIRLGVSGTWGGDGIKRVDTLSFRIPHKNKCPNIDFRGLFKELSGGEGILVYSKPLGGKTTVLREAIRSLSSGKDPVRVVAVDTRGELKYGSSSDWCVDFLSHYPKKEGIEIAIRTMGAQAVVCDEIGIDEVLAICELHGGGVPLLASAHAGSLSDLLLRQGMDELHRRGVFGIYVELRRGEGDGYIIRRRSELVDL